jgi:uncharacterized protein
MKVGLRWLAVVAVASFNLVACSGDSDGAAQPGDEQDVVSSGARFESFTGIDGQTYFHLVAGNGELVMQSEGYSSLEAAQKGVASVKDNGTLDGNYKVLQASDGEFYFNLVGANNKIIGSSEMYPNKSNAERAVTQVRALVAKIKRFEAIAAEPKASFAVFTGMDGLFYFNLRAKNGEIVLQSQSYTSKQNALKGMSSVRANGTQSQSYGVFQAADGQFAVRLVASNSEIIAHGETYASKSNAERAVNTMTELLSGNVPGPDKT